MSIDPANLNPINSGLNNQRLDNQGPIGDPEVPFAPTNKQFYEKLMEGFVMETLRQMQQHDEALKKAMRKARH